MSIHPSLRAADTMKRHRSVLSRLERIKILQEKGSLGLEGYSVLGLPKVKHLKIRVKKEKSTTAAEGETATAAAGAPEQAPAAAAGSSAKRPAGPAAAESPKPKK